MNRSQCSHCTFARAGSIATALKTICVSVSQGTATRSWGTMKRTCRVPGCGAETASRFSLYCRNHKARIRRHGAVNQTGITSADLKPYLVRVRRRIKKNAASPAWGQLDGRWLTVVDHARDVVSAANAGRAGPGYERTAAYEVLKLAEAVKPREVVETALAMFMMQELEPQRFRSDAGFRFQLVRRVRALGDVNVGEYFDDETGRMKRVYRELSPRALVVMGEWLAAALGAAGVHLGRLELADQEKQLN